MHEELEVHRKFADIAGSKMSYLDVGLGPVLVLGHSYLWAADMWAPQIRELSQRYRVIVPELWGHGQSGALPAGALTLRDIAQHHLELLDMLGIEKFVIAGLSVGGMWAVELALLCPSRVAGLLLMGTFAGSEPAPSQARYLSMLDTVASMEAVPDTLIEAMLPLFFSTASLGHRSDLIECFRTRLREAEQENLMVSIVPLGRMIFQRRDALTDLSKLSMPALVITGHEDRSRPPAEGRVMARILRCDFVELLGVGHISTLEAPDEVTQRLRAFLAAVF